MMRYNVSGFGDSLRRAILKDKKLRVAEIMQLYVKDREGNKLRGLVKRRKFEAKLLLSSVEEREKIAKRLEAEIAKRIKRAKKSFKKSLK